MKRMPSLLALCLMFSVSACSKPPEVLRLSDAELDAGRRFADQYETLSCQSTLSEECRHTIENSLCSILVPQGWVQTSPTHFERRTDDQEADQRMPEIIKLIEYPTVGGSLEAAIDQFAMTARVFVENYDEQKRWSTRIDGHPAVAVCYQHTEESAFPGQTGMTKAFFTIRPDKYDSTRRHTVIINCSAPRETFESLEPLFDEIACRTMLGPQGT